MGTSTAWQVQWRTYLRSSCHRGEEPKGGPLTKRKKGQKNTNLDGFKFISRVNWMEEDPVSLHLTTCRARGDNILWDGLILCGIVTMRDEKAVDMYTNSDGDPQHQRRLLHEFFLHGGR